MHLITDCRFREENASVIGDVEIVRNRRRLSSFTDRKLRLVSSVAFSTWRLGVIPIETHAADTDIEIVTTIKCHA